MANIMLSSDDALVCVFTEEEISADVVRRGFAALGHTFNDVYAVKDCELEFYSYEPLWLNAGKLARLRAAAAQNASENV